MALILPQLPGVAWPMSVDVGGWKTMVETSSSGKQTRFAMQVQPRHKRTLVVEALDSSGAFTGLVSNSLQSLFGFYNQCFGQLLPFMYWAPEDCFTTASPFGVGDGSTTTFQLARAFGGFSENVYAPFSATTFTSIPGPNGPYSPSANVYAPMNTMPNSIGTNAGFTLSAATMTGSQLDPLGSSYGQLVAETATTASHYGTSAASAIVVGGVSTFSLHFKQGTSRYAQIGIQNPGATSYAWANVDMQTGTITSSGSVNTTTAPVILISTAANGFYRVSVSCILDNASATAYGNVACVNSSGAGWVPSYLGVATNNFTVALPQLEADNAQGQAPGTFNPTLATPYYGSPQIYVNGVYQDPTAYTLGSFSAGNPNGKVGFSVAPAAAATLSWTGSYYWWCNWDDDTLNVSEFMSGLWESKKLSFTTRVF